MHMKGLADGGPLIFEGPKVPEDLWQGFCESMKDTENNSHIVPTLATLESVW